MRINRTPSASSISQTILDWNVSNRWRWRKWNVSIGTLDADWNGAWTWTIDGTLISVYMRISEIIWLFRNFSDSDCPLLKTPMYKKSRDLVYSSLKYLYFLIKSAKTAKRSSLSLTAKGPQTFLYHM